MPRREKSENPALCSLVCERRLRVLSGRKDGLTYKEISAQESRSHHTINEDFKAALNCALHCCACDGVLYEYAHAYRVAQGKRKSLLLESYKNAALAEVPDGALVTDDDYDGNEYLMAVSPPAISLEHVKNNSDWALYGFADWLFRSWPEGRISYWGEFNNRDVVFLERVLWHDFCQLYVNTFGRDATEVLPMLMRLQDLGCIWVVQHGSEILHLDRRSVA